MTTDQSQSNAEPKQDVRQSLELQLFDLVELARDSRSDKGGAVRWVHPRGDLVKEFAKRIAALAQPDEGPVATDAMIKAAASVLANVDGYDLNVDVNWRDNYERIAHNMLEAALTVPAPPTASAGLAKEIEELKRENKVLRAITRGAAKADASVGLIEAAEWLSTAASRFEEAADALRSEYKTYARQMDRWAGDTRERARLFGIFSRAADRGVHGELIPDCPTDGVAARQGNGG